MSDVQVSDHPEVERYEISVDGRRAGLAAYELEGDVIAFTHTEIDARARGLKVRPLCPFIRGWIKRHDDYADLVVRTA